MMKTTKMIGILALAASVLLASCNKTPAANPPQVAVEVSDITSTSAAISVTVTGDAPGLVRLTPAAEFEAAGLDIADQAAVSKYATDKGSAVSVPYQGALTGLEPFVEYVVCAIAFDADMKPASSAAVKFTTAAPDNAIGDPSGAGEVTARTL